MGLQCNRGLTPAGLGHLAFRSPVARRSPGCVGILPIRRASTVSRRAKSDDDEDWVEYKPEKPWIPGTYGPPQRTVTPTWHEAYFTDEVNVHDMNYWFTTPPGGWPPNSARGRYVKKAPSSRNRVYDSPRHEDTEGRLLLESIEEGMLVTGRIVSIMAYAGLLVDFGGEFDGLIPATDNSETDDWQDVPSYIGLGTEIEARVYRVLRDTKLYRFPIQLVPADPILAAAFPPPEQHEPPMDLRHPRSPREWEELIKQSGRDYQPEQYSISTPLEMWRQETADLEEGRDKKLKRRRRQSGGELEAECDAIAANLLSE